MTYDATAPLALNASGSVTIAEIELASPRTTRLEIDPALTMLVDRTGTQKATVANRALTVSGTTVGGEVAPGVRTPNHE